MIAVIQRGVCGYAPPDLSASVVLTTERNEEFSFDFNDGCQDLILLESIAVDLKGLTSMRSLYDLRVLVVDDNPDDRELLAILLEQEGVEVILAASANEALEWCQKTAIDVLLSDICMPGQDGYTLIQKVRLLPPSPGQVPAIALSSSLSDTYREQALRAGFQRYLFKPIDIDKLIATILELAC